MMNLSTTMSTNSIVQMQKAEDAQILPTNEFDAGIKYDDVYITPSRIKFTEAIEGAAYRQRITIKNIGNKPVLIKIHQTNSIAFQVKALKSAMRVSPGLSITTCVTYIFKRPSLLRAIIPIEVNGKIFPYHVVCMLAVEGIAIEPKTIDFGIIDIGYSSSLKIITLRNEGGKSTKFSIDLGNNDLGITVKPLRGVVKPGREVKLRIELTGTYEGITYSEFWIKSVPNIRVPVKVNVIVPRLVIYHTNTTGDFSIVDFPPTVENTSRHDTFVLRNLSSRVSSYVVLGELDNEVKCIRDIDRKRYPIYNAFKIRPIEGRMDPFQGIIFEVEFSPTTNLLRWRQKRECKQRTKAESLKFQNEDFMAFIRIVKVHCTGSQDIIKIDPVKDITAMDTTVPHRIYIEEAMTETSSSSTTCRAAIDSSDVIKVCLYGEMEAARLYVEPDILYFGDLLVGHISQRVLRLTNPSNVAPIYLECVPNAAARCCPNKMQLKTKASIEVLVKVRGKESVKSSFKLFFNVTVNSYDSTPSGRYLGRIKVGSYSVECAVNVILISKAGLLSEKSSPAKTANDDEEIMKRILRSPKWRRRDYLKVIDKFADCVQLEKSILTSKTAILIPLSPAQMYNVHIHPTMFAFGTVASNSFNYRQLIVRNTNDIPVMIRLISPKCIDFPEGNLIILQPGSTMTRVVEYRASNIGKFNGYIDYVINDNQFFDLNVTADVVRKQLYLERTEIELGKEWSSEEAYRPAASVVRITNKLAAQTYFRWEIPVTFGFRIEPMSGSVRGNSTLYVYAYHEFAGAKTDHAQATMKCESGSRASLRLIAPPFVPKVEFVNADANLGEIPLNLPTKVFAVLQNFEFHEVTYEVDGESLIHGCNVNPSRGKISPRGIAILEVCLVIDVCCHFATAIDVTIHGSLRLLYKMNGTVLFPRLKISPQRIDMERVSADTFQRHQMTVTNEGTTMLKLQFLLYDYPEFHVSLSENSDDSDAGTEGITIAPRASRSLYLHFQPNDIASYSFHLPMVVNQLLGPISASNPKSIKPSEYLKPRETHYAHLPGFVLTPLPAIIDKLPPVTIDCIVTGRVVSFSKLLFQFNVATGELCEEFRIGNQVSRETTVSIKIEEFSKADCPFTIERSRGAEVSRTSDSLECTLCIGGGVSFVLEFKPKKRGNFSIEAPIHVRGQLDDGVFNKLRLQGEFPASSIDVEPTEIYFTPVPLGTAIEEKFRIRARHFDNAAFVRPNFPTTSRSDKDELLHVEFTNGNAVPPHLDAELEGKVTFKSEKPTSFCSTIEFRDDRALAVCSLTVYATADNSLLTTYVHLIRSSDFNTRETSKKPLSGDGHVSYSSDSSTNEDDCDFDNGHITFHANKQNRHSLGIDSNLSRDEEINANNNETDVMDGKDEKKIGEDNRKRMSIFKRNSVFLTESGARKRRPSRRSSYYLYGRNDDVYEEQMQRITAAAEEWMYSGPLKYQFYPNIPFGITAIFSKYCLKRKASTKDFRGKNNTIPSFIDVLESVVGSKIHDYLGELLKQKLPEQDIERVGYILQLYDKILDFLLSHGAHLIHVSTQFLLNYDDYLISINIAQNNSRRKKSRGDVNSAQRERLSRQLFEARNTQCWLDVVLQTYKCFVLAGIHEPKSKTIPSSVTRFSKVSATHRESASVSSLPTQCGFHEKATQSVTDLLKDESSSDNSHCREEKFLLLWLRHHYEQQRTRDWMTDRRIILNPREKRDTAESRLLQNFHSDLSNCLVLIAVTAAYCPFLIDDCFNNLYICPRNDEETLHNAVCLVTAWRKIRLAFAITPMQLVHPNQLQILMLTNHLFQTLPTYAPCAKVKLSCPLSQTVTKQISISNPTDDVINYLPVLVNNVNHFFNILKPASVLRLNARESGQVLIQFHAKKIRKCKTYLLLCGRAIGPNFGKNQTITLEGCIDSLGIANVYTIHSRLYEIIETDLRINIPYQNAAEYDISMTEERPSYPSNLKMTRWCELLTKKVPRRLFLNQSSIVVAEDTTEAYLSISVACAVPKKRTFWLIFQAKTSDFIIQINSICRASTINDHIVVKWTNRGECICLDQKNGTREACPFNISIPIPSRNVQFWRCVFEMFKKTLDSKERFFWSKYLDTYIGLRLIRWLIGDYTDQTAFEFVHIFNTAVTYKVAISDRSNGLIIPEYFTIQDVRPFNEQVSMIVHISPLTPVFYKTTMILTSLDSKEIRMYTIDFLRL